MAMCPEAHVEEARIDAEKRRLLQDGWRAMFAPGQQEEDPGAAEGADADGDVELGDEPAHAPAPSRQQERAQHRADRRHHASQASTGQQVREVAKQVAEAAKVRREGVEQRVSRPCP